MSITFIENLSNDCFYELFDYLEGYHIYQAFSNLNDRFQRLLQSSSLRFKIKPNPFSDELYTDTYNQFVQLHKHQFLSFHLLISDEDEHFFSLFPIDSLFTRLEALVLYDVEAMPLNSFLSKLTCLPRLFSLAIDMGYNSDDLIDIYPIIFTLPNLKYFKYSAEATNIPVSLSLVSKSPMSSIEHLVINHSCTFKILSVILSHTPELRRLKFSHLNDTKTIITSLSPLKLSKLTDMSFDVPYITFDEFKMFITSVECPLKVLHFNTRSTDETYLDANQWEELILGYLSQLENFYFQYAEEIELESNLTAYIGGFNQFNSSFWSKRKWVFKTEMDSLEIIHSIRPYRKQWYDIHSVMESSKTSRLNLTCASDESIQDLLTVTQFYHMEFQYVMIDFDTLINIIYRLSELDSLKIHSLSLSSSSSKESCTLGKIIRRLLLTKNKITKVCLGTMVNINEVYVLIKLCPRMNYLQINAIKTMDVETVIHDILSKIKDDCNQNLRLLCFHVSTVDNKMIDKLKGMINSEKLLFNYIINHESDHIYLQW